MMFKIPRPFPCSFLRTLLMLLLLSSLTGCATLSSKNINRTSGVTLRLRKVDEPGGAAAVYRVDRDGTLGFGGGASAHFDRITWNGDMSDSEIAELLGLIDRYGWFEQDPKGTGQPQGLMYRVELNGRSWRRFTVYGQCESVQAVEGLLDRIARQRFDPILDSLPKPSQPDSADPGP